MKAKLVGLLGLIAFAGVSGTTAHAQELLLGYLPSLAGPFATLSRTNEIAAQIAVDEINAAGGINGKKVKIISFDTAGKPDQAVVGLRKLAEDDKVLPRFPDSQHFIRRITRLGRQQQRLVERDVFGGCVER